MVLQGLIMVIDWHQIHGGGGGGIHRGGGGGVYLCVTSVCDITKYSIKFSFTIY